MQKRKKIKGFFKLVFETRGFLLKWKMRRIKIMKKSDLGSRGAKYGGMSIQLFQEGKPQYCISESIEQPVEL